MSVLLMVLGTLELAGGAAGMLLKEYQDWHIVNVTNLICTRDSNPQYNTIRFPNLKQLEPTAQNRPHVVTFFRTSQLQTSITYRLSGTPVKKNAGQDANPTILADTVVLDALQPSDLVAGSNRRLSFSVHAVPDDDTGMINLYARRPAKTLSRYLQDQPSASQLPNERDDNEAFDEDLDEELVDQESTAEEEGDDDEADARERRLRFGRSSGSRSRSFSRPRPRPSPAPRPRPSPATSVRRRAPAPAFAPQGSATGGKFTNPKTGLKAGYSSPSKVNSNFNSKVKESKFGFSGKSKFGKSSKLSSGLMTGLAVAGGLAAGAYIGLVVAPAVFGLFNYWWDGCNCWRRRPCFGPNNEEYYDCDDCFKVHPRGQCAPQLAQDLYRDDILIGAFRPMDYLPGSVELRVESLTGAQYNEAGYCPPSNWTIATANQSSWPGPAGGPADLFVTLTAVDEFSTNAALSGAQCPTMCFAVIGVLIIYLITGLRLKH